MTENAQEKVVVTVDPLKGVVFDDGAEEGVVETPVKEEEVKAETPAVTKVEEEVKPKVEAEVTETPAVVKEEGGVKPEEVKTETETPINQEAVNKRINKITFEKYEEKKKREEAEAALEAANQKLADLQKPEEVVIPELPDVYDPEFDKKLADREAAIRAAAVVQANKDAALQEKVVAQNQLLVKQQEEVKELVTNMFTAGEKLGVQKEELQQHDVKVAQFIKDPDVAKFILKQEHSPLIVKYLAGNATELESLAALSPVEASARIATVVTTEAMKLKPDVSTTPEPIEIPGGKVTKQQSPFLDGVTFE